MNLPDCHINGRPIALERRIGKGGEGEVFLMAGRPTHAVKIYSAANRISREEKVAAMIHADLGNRSALASFPLALVRGRDGAFIGFVMRLMDGYQPIHELYAPGSRKQHFPRADYRFLARVATNIAKAFASVHQLGCVVGDINHSGIFVSQKATAALIDADSFQFSVAGQQYLCKVGVPEYTPPELQGKSLTGAVRTVDHDAFGLAVVLFQILLMGRHPFIGRVRQGEMPSYEESIRDFRYVYAEDRDVGMDQPPGTPAMSDFSPELAGLFNRAFSKDYLTRRPSAQEWIGVLERFENSLVQCAQNPLHHAPRGVSECPWCEMEQRLQTYLFAPYVNGIADTLAAHDTVTAAQFDLRIVWGRIERVQVTALEQLQPVLAPVTAEPSLAARAARKAAKKAASRVRVDTRILFLFIASIIGVLAPRAWIVAAIIAVWGITRPKNPPPEPVNPQPFLDEFIAARKYWFTELEGWRRRTGLAELVELRASLAQARDVYQALGDEERRQVRQYHSQRRERQLYHYLEGFDLARANIVGIGHGKLAALASYGIDTAATVQPERVMNVPGFGEFMTKRVWDWREKHAAHFVYNAAPNDTDQRELARIRTEFEKKAAELRATLMNGSLQLEARSLRTQEFSRQSDPILARVQGRIAQASADLRYLHVPEPTVPQPSVRASSQPTGATVATPRCPKCKSAMRQRTAVRGAYAGKVFWGCVRYPDCKGTRPV